MKRTLAAALPGAALALALLLPFLGKAHTIDDVTFLLQSQHVLRDPLHPTAFDLVADGTRIRLSARMVSGPVMAYLLVPSAWMGGAEPPAHLVQLALLLLAIGATVALAFRLGLVERDARLAGVLLAATPAVAAMATTAMPDVPAMAFGAFGIERLLAWRDERRAAQGLIAAAGLALAALARPHLLMLLPVGAIALLGLADRAGGTTRAPVRRAWWWPLLLAAALVWLTLRLTADPASAGADIAQGSTARFAWPRVVGNLLAFAVHWVFVLPLALFWAGIRARRLARSPAFWVALPVAAWLLHRAGIGPLHLLLLAPAAALGAWALADVVWEGLARRDRDQLCLGAWLLVALPAVGYDHTPAKYLVASAPAVALLVARAVGRAGRGRGPAWAMVAYGVVLSLLVISTDARYADVARQAARDLIAPRVAAGERVWAYGGWGFEWYALRAGARPVALEPPLPQPGDVLVACGSCPWARLDRFPRRSLLAEIRERSRLGLIMSRERGAGFYSNAWGLLPWAPWNGELEHITVWRLE